MANFRFYLNKHRQSESQDTSDIISGRYKRKLSIHLVTPVEGALWRVCLGEKEAQARDFELHSNLKNLEFIVEN